MNNQNRQQSAPAQQQNQSLALAPVETTQHALALVPSSIDGAYQLAAWLSNAQLLPPALRGKQADLFTMILAGMELGLPPMAALRGMYIVNGKPALESRTKAAICLQRGAALYFRRTEHTPQATTWETLRAGQTEPVLSRYTLKEADAAGLTRKDGPWQTYPQRMISHRALGWLCDDVYPDIVLGVATAEDFDDAEVTFKPIASVATGIELGEAPGPAKPKASPPPGAPSTAKSANPPVETAKTDTAKTDAPKTDRPLPTEDEIIDLIESMSKCGTVKALRELAFQRIAGVPDGPIRDRLAKAYEAQRDEILEAERLEKEGGQS